MVFIKYLPKGITFILGLNFKFLGENKKNWFECKTIIIFLIILSSIHIKICENVIININTRWCKMKETTPTDNGEHVIMVNMWLIQK